MYDGVLAKVTLLPVLILPSTNTVSVREYNVVYK
jgi:hypothetical protein